MAIDFTRPTTTENYATGFVPAILDNQIAQAQMLDSTHTTITGTPPTYAKRYNRTASRLSEFNGATWNDLDLEANRLVTPRAINGVNFDGSANITIVDATKLPLTGGSITGTLNSDAAEAMSVGNNAGYFEFWNTPRTLRTGYIQFNTAVSMVYAAENGAEHRWSVGGSLRLSLGTTGHLTPGVDNTQTLGASGKRWSTIYGVSFSGNATTATKLANSININGVAFDGSASIVVAAAGSTLTGTALAAGISTSSLDTVGSGCTDGSFELGYKDMPQFIISGSMSLSLTHRGKGGYHTSATAHTVTIPANAAVAFPIGTVINLDNEIGGGILSIGITTDTLVMDGAGTTGTRSLAAGGNATLRKVSATRWRIGGVKLT